MRTKESMKEKGEKKDEGKAKGKDDLLIHSESTVNFFIKRGDIVNFGRELLEARPHAYVIETMQRAFGIRIMISVERKKETKKTNVGERGGEGEGDVIMSLAFGVAIK